MSEISLECSECGDVPVKSPHAELFYREDTPSNFLPYFRFICSCCNMLEVVPTMSDSPEDMAVELGVTNAADVTYPYLEMYDPARRLTDPNALVDYAITFHELLEGEDALAAQAYFETKDKTDLAIVD